MKLLGIKETDLRVTQTQMKNTAVKKMWRRNFLP